MIECISHCYFNPSLFNPSPLFVDGGSCHGQIVIPFLKRFEKATAICVEPAPESFEVLEHELSANELMSRCQLWRGALWEKSEEDLTFWVWSKERQRNSFFPCNGEGPTQPDTKVQVRTITIDRLIGKQVVDLLKLDIEGAESVVLESLSTETARQIRQISVELHPIAVPRCQGRIWVSLIRCGYKIVEFSERPNILFAFHQ
jgi:FkbM family methyltransferase